MVWLHLRCQYPRREHFFSRIFHRIQQPISKLRIPNFHELFTNHIVCDEKTMTLRCIKFVLIGQKFRENLDLVVGSSEQDIPNSFQTPTFIRHTAIFTIFSTFNLSQGHLRGPCLSQLESFNHNIVRLADAPISKL